MTLRTYLLVGSMRDRVGWAVLKAEVDGEAARRERDRLMWRGTPWDNIDVEEVEIPLPPGVTT